MIELNKVIWSNKNFSVNFSFKIKKKEKVVIFGKNGSGKTTLLNLISGFLPIKNGTLYINNIDHTHTPPSKRPVSILFQKNNLFPHLTVEENIGLGLHPGLKLSQEQERELKKVAKEMEIDNILKKNAEKISGGQQQRSALARCLIQKKPILLLDEPFSSIDLILKSKIMNIMEKFLFSKKITLLIVTHDINTIQHRKISRSLIVSNGNILYDGSLTKIMKDFRKLF